MVFSTKIEITFDRKKPPEDNIQFYRIYRKKNEIPERVRSELICIISQPQIPENDQDTIIRVDSNLPQSGVSYDPLEQIDLIDPRSTHYKIAIDDSLPIPPTNVIAIPDPSNNATNIGNLLIQWTPSIDAGTIWGYDVTAIDSAGLESPEGAFLSPSESSKLETINIGLADGETPVPSEYPLAGQIFNQYIVTGGSQTFTVNGQNSLIDNNHNQGWDISGPNPVSGQSALGNLSERFITLRWNESIKNIGANLTNKRFRVTAFTKAGYSSSSVEVPGPSSVITPITDGTAGTSITRIDATRWHDGTTTKGLPAPTPEVLIAPNELDGSINIAHGSMIRGSVTVTDHTGHLFYIEDSGTFNFPNGDGDYIVDYSRTNGTSDVGGRIKILRSGIILPGQIIHIIYKFGVDFGTGMSSLRPSHNDHIVNPYNGTKWSGTGSQSFNDIDLEEMSAYNYAWNISDNSGRISEAKYAQGILQDITFPEAITNFKVEAVIKP